MSLESVQKTVPAVAHHGGIFEEMQREDFLAMAAALRQLNAFQALVPVIKPPRRVADEPRLVLASTFSEAIPGR
ncbi:hypothetical protein PS3A_14760 [Pseudomonas sp. 3A(2025)]